MRVLFAHGFEGGPEGSKPTYMREVLGWDVTSPVMSDLGWTIRNQTEVLLRLIDEYQLRSCNWVIHGRIGGSKCFEHEGEIRLQITTNRSCIWAI